MKNSKFMKATAILFTMILLIGSTFAENIVFEFNGDNGGGVSAGQTNADWDDHRESVYAYIYMDVLDDDGNDAAYLSVTVGRSYYGIWVWPNGNQIDAVEYSASACVYTAGWKGRANARIDVPGNQNDDQQKMDIGGVGNPSAVYASGSSRRDKGALMSMVSVRLWLRHVLGLAESPQTSNSQFQSSNVPSFHIVNRNPYSACTAYKLSTGWGASKVPILASEHGNKNRPHNQSHCRWKDMGDRSKTLLSSRRRLG